MATACSDVLADAGLRVLRVGHVAGACERIPVVMPQLVVVATELRAEDSDMLADRCVAVGAEVFKVSFQAGPEVGSGLEKRLKDAANMALIRSMRRGSGG